MGGAVERRLRLFRGGFHEEGFVSKDENEDDG
jgi:hypothetical protein